MSETTNDPAASEETGSAEGTDPLKGYVPESELERERLRSRSFQSERDRLQAEIDKLKAAPASKDEGGESERTPALGFDPEEFRNSVFRDAYHATSMARAAESLREKYPYASDDLFKPERLRNFTSVEAFELAVDQSHSRVAEIVKGERDKTATELRKEMQEKYGISVSSTPESADGSPPSGDPTPEQLARMTPDQWRELEKKSPGLTDRVLMRAANQ